MSCLPHSWEVRRRQRMQYFTRTSDEFAAVLEEEEAAEIAKHPDVVSVFLNHGRKLHTTHSWDFLMLERNGVIHPSSLWRKARFSEDTIIANLDTGVWPESMSFSDKEIHGPIPSKWKGICQFDGNDDKSLCNSCWSLLKLLETKCQIRRTSVVQIFVIIQNANCFIGVLMY